MAEKRQVASTQDVHLRDRKTWCDDQSGREEAGLEKLGDRR